MTLDILIAYAMTFIGLPYKWGGDDALQGFDCSGFIQEVLSSVGADPIGDQTAHGLYRYFSKNGNTIIKDDQPIKRGSLLFFGKPERITHVAIAIDSLRMIEAGGGTSSTRTANDAARDNAYIRIRPIRRRKDFVDAILPNYHFEDGE